MENEDAQKALQCKERGNDYFKNKQYIEAIEQYDKAITLDPSEASFYANRAACYLGLKKFSNCIADCQETINRKPDFIKAWKRKARAHFSIGEMEMAKKCYEKAAEIDPSDKSIKDEMREVSRVEYLASEVLKNIELCSYTQAINYVNEILRINPDQVDAKIKKIEILAMQGHTKEAVQFVQDYQQDLGINNNFLHAKGFALACSGKTENAKKVWTDAVRMDPDNQLCKQAIKKLNKQDEAKQKGNDFLKSSNFAQAINQYTEGIEIDPHNSFMVSQLLNNRAAAKMKQKSLSSALDDCNKAIERNPKYARAYLRRGDIKKEMGNKTEAVVDFKKAHELDPELGADSRYASEQKQQQRSGRGFPGGGFPGGAGGFPGGFSFGGGGGGQQFQRPDSTPRKDYYKILGVEKDATEDQIKKAYRKLALKWHPDKAKGTEEEKAEAEKKFKDISEAYSVIGNKEKRQRYDNGADFEDGNGNGGFSGGGVDPNEIFKQFFGGGDPFGFTADDDDMGGMGGLGGFTKMFMGGGGRGGQAGGFPGGMKFQFQRG